MAGAFDRMFRWQKKTKHRNETNWEGARACVVAVSSNQSSDSVSSVHHDEWRICSEPNWLFFDCRFVMILLSSLNGSHHRLVERDGSSLTWFYLVLPSFTEFFVGMRSNLSWLASNGPSWSIVAKRIFFTGFLYRVSFYFGLFRLHWKAVTTEKKTSKSATNPTE